MAAPAPRCVCVTAINLSSTAGRRCERETSGMAISNCRSRSGTKKRAVDRMTEPPSQRTKCRSTRARDHPYLARNWKFESIPLQQTVRLSPDFAFVPGKARVFRQCRGEAKRHGRQRRARSSNIALMNGGVSVGRYFSTAVSPMWLAVGAPPPSAVGPLGLQQYR
jgi:hypothetical protein